MVYMGDLQVWPQPNGISTEESAPSANPHPSVIDANRWAKAELRTSEIILCIQPTVKSEQKRNKLIEYVRRLLQRRFGLEVFAFGSVPLKTYLPDGDVDLTTISNYQSIERKWANDVRAVLEGEEHNKLAEFRVKEVKYIHAEVKLVKCLVENFVVDISFNQLGGLCTLCFFEKVDQLIGKDHLFKRSIILVKAWCYYESRILGASHGLISTYALDILVLYIFHLFHASLHGPLEVLYRFLDYFSKFDWDNYCLSFQGPVAISPDNNAEPPERDGGDLLLSNNFLKAWTDRFSFPPKGHDNQNRSLTLKNLNIIDPLQENSNLGRSVNKGNFRRIRSAFTYGAKKLGQILLSSEEKIAEELDKFFLNTVERHVNGNRPDVPDSIFCSLDSSLVGETTGFQQLLNSDVKEKFDKNASRTTPLSGVSCFEGSNTPSCGTATCSGIIPVGSVLDALRHQKADLDGDFDNHSKNLEYAKLCQELGSHGSGLPYPKVIQEGPASYFNVNKNVYPCMRSYRVGPHLLHPSSYIYIGGNRVILPRSFSGEELSKPRNGIGTYIR